MKNIGKRIVLVVSVLLIFLPLNGCDFISSILEMFSSGAGGAAAEATSDTVGGEAGKALGSVAGDAVKTTVKKKGSELIEKKKKSSETGQAEDSGKVTLGDSDS